jgi:AdoMet-dependent heme synthase
MIGPRPEFKAPLYIAWEVTRRCNARCLHCYSESGPDVRDPSELSTADALRIIDQLAEAGLLILAFSGGEPLLRHDIYELIARAVEKELVVNIATNGAKINDRVAARLKSGGVRSITVSLDGADAATHDHMRQTPGLFRRTLRAIEILVAHDLRVVVSFTPSLLNHDHGRRVVQLSHELGASAVNMSEYVPAGRGTQAMMLPPETLQQVVQDWIAMRREYEGRMQIIWHDCRVALLVPEAERDLYSGCGAGRLTARLRVDGTLTPCVFLPNSAGDLRTTPFREVWAGSPLLQTIRNRDALHDGNCARCDLKHVCGGCRAVSMSHYGDPMMGDPSCWISRESASLVPTRALLSHVKRGEA